MVRSQARFCTINLPNAKKRKDGRTECVAKLLWFDDTSYTLDAFLLDKGDGFDFGDFGGDQSGSGYGFRFMRDCHAKGMAYEQARAAILADQHQAGEWARRVDERQLERAWERSKPPPLPPPSGKLPLVVELGSKLWGTPTENGKEYRFGTDQSKIIDPIKGASRPHADQGRRG
jgi:hypothetical protein